MHPQVGRVLLLVFCCLVITTPVSADRFWERTLDESLRRTPPLSSSLNTIHVVNPGRPSPPRDLRCDQEFGDIAESAKNIPYNRADFSEIVRLSIPPLNNILANELPSSLNDCTGTVVGANWIITAAHCFAWISTNSLVEHLSGEDILQKFSNSRRVISNRDTIRIDLENERRSFGNFIDETGNIDYGSSINIRRVYLMRSYLAMTDTRRPWNNDIAMIEISGAISHSIRPAQIGPTADNFDVATVGGFGGVAVTNAPLPEGYRNQLNIGWLGPLSRNGNILIARTNLARGWSGICQGDSGGPAFSGLHRGCTSPQQDPRPRQLVGVISFNRPPQIDRNTQAFLQLDNPNRSLEDACLTSSESGFVAITAPEIRGWICRIADQQVFGCR
jgi:hypothetical protein